VSPEAGDTRAALLEALRARDAARAVELARGLAEADAWDQLVAATLVAHGAEDDPLRARAVAELERMQAAERLAAAPDEDGWLELVEALVAAGRLEDAANGVALAWNAGRASATTWKHLCAVLLDRRHAGPALEVARRASEAVGDDGELWAMRAALATDAGERAEAAHAIEEAHRLAPRSPLAWMARARLAIAAGDELAATQALQTARSLGAPLEMLEAFLKLNAIVWKYGL